MGSMETSPSAIAFRGIRNVDMIPFIRDVIDTLREFDLRRVGSSKVYKTRMETELQPHLVPHWVQPLQQPPHTPFFHTRIQKWKRYNMMRVLEAAADEVAGDNAKIAEVSDALRRRVEPMGPHLQVAVDSFIQRLRLNRLVIGALPSGPLLQDDTRVKVEIGAAALVSSITTEDIRVRGKGATPKGVVGGSKSVEDCLSSNSGLSGKRALSKDDSPQGAKPKRQCIWDLSSSKSAAMGAASNSSDSVEKTPGQGEKRKAGCFRFEIPSVDTLSILAFLKCGLKATPPRTPLSPPSPRSTPLAFPARSSGSFPPPPKQVDLKREYDLLGSLDFMLGPISEDQGLTWPDDDVSDSHSWSANHAEFDVSNGVSERLSERDHSPEDLDFEAYQEAVFAAASTHAGEHLERELVEDARVLLQSTLGMGQCSHVGALRLALVAEKLLPVIEQLQERSLGLDALAPEEAQALDMLSGLLMGARERVQNAMEDDSEDILVEMDTATAIEQEASQLEKIADTFLSVVGTEILQEPRVQLRLAAAHNRLAAALSHQGWVEEAQSQMSQANSILTKLRVLAPTPKPRALSPPPECPISMEKMEDPVVLTTGHTFERSAIQRWLNAGNTTCPITRQQLTDLELVPNKALRGYSARWHAENGLEQPQAPEWPELTLATSPKIATQSDKCEELFQVDDLLGDVLKGALGFQDSGVDMFGLGEVVNGKCGEGYSVEGGLSSDPVEEGQWNLDMMHWAVST